ncbi:MAG: hypothetical protein JWL93_1794 [Hyphomicrobiales bacterium]|nr:hypothetical protein [Hyphomicrobiales bacterium]
MDSFLKALTVRHRLLDEEITKEQSRPHPDAERILNLKIRRLQLRDQLECVKRDLNQTRRASPSRRALALEPRPHTA